MTDMTGSLTPSRIGFPGADTWAAAALMMLGLLATNAAPTASAQAPDEAPTQSPAQAPAPSSASVGTAPIPKPRLAVVASTGALTDGLLARLTRAGFEILDPAWHPRAADGRPAGLDRFLGHADLVISASLEGSKCRRQQGRYRVKANVVLRLTHPDTGMNLWTGGSRSQGESFDSYGDARERLLDEALGADLLKAGLIAELRKFTEDEATKGRRVRIVVTATESAADQTVHAALDALEGVVDGSLRASKKTVLGRDGEQRDRAVFQLRYRGSMKKLRNGLRQAIRDADPNARISIRHAPRTLRIMVTPGVVAADSTEQVRNEVDRMLDDLTEGRRDKLAGLEGTIEAKVERVQGDGMTVVESVVNQAKDQAAAAKLQQEVEASVRRRGLFKALKPDAKTVIKANLRTFDDTCVLDGKLVNDFRALTEIVHAVSDPIGAMILHAIDP